MSENEEFIRFCGQLVWGDGVGAWERLTESQRGAHCAVDWLEVHRLADRWGILRPDLLLNIWRDFFPEGTLPPEDASFAEQQGLRTIRNCVPSA